MPDLPDGVDRKWTLQAVTRRSESGDAANDMIFLWLGEWALIVFTRQVPVFLTVQGTGAWIVEISLAPKHMRKAIESVMGVVGSRSLSSPLKPVTLDQLAALVRDALDGVAGKVVARFEGDEPGKEIVTVERSTKIPG